MEYFDTVTIDVVVPAHNEEAYLGRTLEALKRVPTISKVIVVDDGSLDGTSAVAKAHDVGIITLKRNMGKSAALMAGVQKASSEYVLMLDADIGDSAIEITKLIDAYPAGEDACIVALFPVIPGRGGGLGLAVRVARIGSRLLGGWQMAAPLSGQRLLRRETLESIFPLPYGFGLETAMNVRLGRANIRLIEVQTQMDHRVTQNDVNGRIHRAKQLIHLIMAIIRECFH
jgi:glycosyltransferase involved in cell wall biosynthesis